MWIQASKAAGGFWALVNSIRSEVNPLWQCDLELIRLVSRFSLSTSALYLPTLQGPALTTTLACSSSSCHQTDAPRLNAYHRLLALNGPAPTNHGV